MCIEELTNACTAYSRQIIEAIDKEDDHEVRRVDALLRVSFDKILEKHPSNGESRRLQAEYLLSVLAPQGERTKNQNDICNKLLEIISD